MSLVRRLITEENISNAYDAISYGSATIERASNGEDLVTITTETANEFAIDWLSYEGVAFIAGHSIALPLTTFISIMAPTEMGNGSLPNIDTYPIHLTGRALLDNYLPTRVRDQFAPPLSLEKFVVQEKNVPVMFRDIPGLIYQPVPDDGHCLFHAVGLHLGQDQAALRRQVVEYLEAHIEDFGEFIDLEAGEEIEDYLRAMRDENEWGGQIEIEALTRMLNRSIIVVTQGGNIANPDMLQNMRDDPIFVYYNGVNHYNGFMRNDEYSVQQILEQLARRRVVVEEANLQLIEGAKVGNLQMIASALRDGADLNVRDNNWFYFSPLHWGVEHQHIEVVDTLLSLGANPNMLDANGWTPFQAAAHHNSPAEMGELLVRQGTDLAHKDNNGHTARDLARIYHPAAHHYFDNPDRTLIEGAKLGNLQMIASALRDGADLNVRDNNWFYFSPLHWGVEHQHIEVVDTLLSLGANPNMLDANGWTPFQAAARHNAPAEMGELLVRQGTDLAHKDNDGHTARDLARIYHLAAHHYFDSVNRKLLDAAKVGNDVRVRELIRAGADINTTDGCYFHYTPLHWAAGRAYTKVADDLLNLGANPNVKADDDMSPLDCACTHPGSMAIRQSLAVAGGRAIQMELASQRAAAQAAAMAAPAPAKTKIQQKIEARAQKKAADKAQRKVLKKHNTYHPPVSNVPRLIPYTPPSFAAQKNAMASITKNSNTIQQRMKNDQERQKREAAERNRRSIEMQKQSTQAHVNYHKLQGVGSSSVSGGGMFSHRNKLDCINTSISINGDNGRRDRFCREGNAPFYTYNNPSTGKPW